ncbi:MAG: sigma-70 family RNA polymerase sigma factor [Verrucomicrobia bacterium]|nr:sigma-70 family RNA polymerase sigma factor [Verrucomicrobiota bacterium]MBV9657104.1 sigma-70 family RNA polymerase sigma factor [Verrucomicrobiota bacterium]
MSLSRIEEDRRLVEHCLHGEASAWQRLRVGLQEPLRSILLGRGATSTEAADLLGDLWADCLGGRNGSAEGLLCKYHGQCALITWLATVATHRLVDLKRRQRFVGQLPAAVGGGGNGGGDSSELTAQIDPFAGVAAPEPERAPAEAPLLELMLAALRHALSKRTPEERVMLRLVYLEAIPQRVLARMWSWHESKVSRALDAAMERIREDALGHVRRADPWLELSWTDFLQLCEASNKPLF